MKLATGLLLIAAVALTALVPGLTLAEDREPRWANVDSDLEGPDYLQPPRYYRTLPMILAEAGLGPAPLGPPPEHVTGTRELLVILVELTDATPNASHNVAYFNDRFFDTSPPSVRDFYDEVSYGNFTFVPGAVLGWYASSYSTWHWDNDTVNDSADCRDVVYEAIQLADADFDYSGYDANSDGKVTNDELTIFIIVSGNADGAFHWYTFSNTTSLGPGPGSPTCDGKAIEGEFSATHEDRHIGSYCHELGHDLGLPDLYDTNGGSEGIGQYGLMGGGSWTFSYPTAWCKIQLGWITPTVVSGNGFFNIDDSETHAEAFILRDPGHSMTEYFLVEYRRPSQSYYETVGAPIAPDGVFPDSGLVIYHVDDTMAQDWITSGVNNVNTDETHKGVDVETAEHATSHVLNADDLDAAVNRGDGDDLWDCGEYDFHDASNPCASVWYGGGSNQIGVRVLPCIGPSMMTYLSVSNLPPIALCDAHTVGADMNCCIQVEVDDIDDGSYDPDGASDIASLLITAVDGSPVTPATEVEVCGAGFHDVTLTITDRSGLSDACDATVEVVNHAPFVDTRPYMADADENCCITVDVDDITSLVTDAEDNLVDVSITAVDGNPVTPAQEVEVCGEGTHTATLTATDACGATSSDVATVTVLNEAPVAVCQSHVGEADSNCCIVVTVDDIDGGTYDPNGPDDIVELCITEVDGVPVGCVEEVELCGVATYTLTLEATDKCGATDECDATVELIDTTPPEISVELNRYVLWPPNHKMADIVATVTVEDNCDPNPQVLLVNVTSNEPDNDGGDGDTDDDIQGADLGTEDYEFQLRSERSGKRLGRIYTIVYSATDFSGNTAEAVVFVRVPHNQPGMITATTGFTGDGMGFSRSQDQFAVVIMSQLEVYGINHNGKVMLVETMFDATQLDLTRTYVGNTMGVLLPEHSEVVDQNGDGMMDLAVWYRIADVEPLVDHVIQGQIGEVWVGDPIDPVGVHYESTSGVDYLVDDIFGLGTPEELGGGSSAGVGDIGEVADVTRLFPVQPNPFSGSTTIRFSLVREEQVDLRIYDARGLLVKTLAARMMPSGQHQVIWDGTDDLGHAVAAGVYFTRFTAGGYSSTEKTMYLR